MKTIKIKLTREENAKFYGVALGSVVTISFQDYLKGVVASEIGAKHREACRAQAVASRTFSYPYTQKDIAIPDTSSSAQAFRAERIDDQAFVVAHQAVADTDGEMLYYDAKLISPCSFSASNGGKTVSSESRWGGYRPYLIEQDDHWDYKATHGEKYGHGVGMSQRGAIYAAKTGISYRDILSFYYPGTYIDKEGTPMAQVKASDLIRIFKQMADEKWKYVAGAHKYGEVDCSGAFYYAYKQLGGYMYHGSNTMWRKYTTQKDRIDRINLVPGMAVFKVREWTANQSGNGWYKDDPGDVYHVGLYVGNDQVVEAKGKKHGVVITSINTWDLAAKLKDTDYDVGTGSQPSDPESGFPFTGIVALNSGYLNLRAGPDKTHLTLFKAYDGDCVHVIGQAQGWYQIERDGRIVYASKDYIRPLEGDAVVYVFTIHARGNDAKQELMKKLDGYEYDISEKEGAA